MSNQADSEFSAISFAERVLILLDQGSFTSTYKYAVLLGLMDLTLEHTSRSGLLPTTITTRQLAEKITEIYWTHTNQYELEESPPVNILQNKGRPGVQASIINDINDFKNTSGVGQHAPYYASKKVYRERFERLLDRVERTLITMPLPKLQRMGGHYKPFIYDIHWSDDIRAGAITLY